MDLKYTSAEDELRKLLSRKEEGVIPKIRNLAEAIAMEVVKHARSQTSETKPGVNPEDGPRKVHPGGWADVTSNLKNSITYAIEINGLKVTAIVKATMEYAAALDAKTGYYVLGGVEPVVRKAIKKYAPKYFDV